MDIYREIELIKSYDLKIQPHKRKLKVKTILLRAIHLDLVEEFYAILDRLSFLSSEDMGIDSEVMNHLLLKASEEIIRRTAKDERFDYTKTYQKRDPFVLLDEPPHIDSIKDYYDLRFILQNFPTSWWRINIILDNSAYSKHQEFNFIIITSAANRLTMENVTVTQAILDISDKFQNWDKIANYIFKTTFNEKINISRALSLGYFLTSPEFRIVVIKNYTHYDLTILTRSFNIITTNSFEYEDLSINNLIKTPVIWPLVEIDRQIILNERGHLGSFSAIIPISAYEYALKSDLLSMDYKIQIVRGRFVNPNKFTDFMWKSRHFVSARKLEESSLCPQLIMIYIQQLLVPFFDAVQRTISLNAIGEDAKKIKNLWRFDVFPQKLIIYTSDPLKVQEQYGKVIESIIKNT